MQSQKLILSSDDWVNVTQTLNLTETQFYYIQSRSATEIDYFISPTPPTATDDGLRLFLTQDWPRVQQPVGSFIFARRAQNSNGDGVLIVSPSYAESSGGGGDGDVVGPNSSTDSTITVFSGATGKIIKEPTDPILANNQQIKNGAPGTDPNDFATVSQISAGSGDVVGPPSATNNAFAVFDGTTGKLIKNPDANISANTWRLIDLGDGVDPTDAVTVNQISDFIDGNVSTTANTLVVSDGASGKTVKGPTAAVSVNNQQLKNGSAATDPTDFVILSQLPSVGGDVVGPNSSTDNTLTVFDGVTGKVIKEPNAAVNVGGQQLKGGAPGTDPNDFATVSQLGGGGSISLVNAEFYDNFLLTGTTYQDDVTPLGSSNFINLRQLITLPPVAYTAISSFNGGAQSLLEIADVSALTPGTIISISDGSYYVGLFSILQIITTGTTGVVIDRPFDTSQSGTFLIQSTFATDLGTINNCTVLADFLVLGTPQVYGGVTQGVSGGAVLQSADAPVSPSTGYFIVNSAGGQYNGIYASLGTVGPLGVPLGRLFAGDDSGTYQTAQFIPAIQIDLSALVEISFNSLGVIPSANVFVDWGLALDSGSGYAAIDKSQIRFNQQVSTNGLGMQNKILLDANSGDKITVIYSSDNSSTEIRNPYLSIKGVV